MYESQNHCAERSQMPNSTYIYDFMYTEFKKTKLTKKWSCICLRLEAETGTAFCLKVHNGPQCNKLQSNTARGVSLV